MKLQIAALSLALLLAACASTAPRVVDADMDQREALFGAITALEGTWEGEAEGMVLHHEFRVTAGGSAVREIMFPGDDMEMTNMYTLDGNTLVLTHYCAAGNQPRMRARSVDGNRIHFAFEDVSDLKAPDEHYMGELTLVLIDADHMEQRWRSLNAPAGDENMVMALTRVR